MKCLKIMIIYNNSFMPIKGTMVVYNLDFYIIRAFKLFGDFSVKCYRQYRFVYQRQLFTIPPK